jgi:tetratricopeptide (TPR) repeat protein
MSNQAPDGANGAHGAGGAGGGPRRDHNKSQHDRAIADFDQAIALNPKNAIAFNFRGKALTFKVEEPVKRQTETALKELGVAG